MSIGSYSVIEDIEDFLKFSSATMGTTELPQGKVMYCSVNEGSFALTTDEESGVLAVTTDTADNDNCALYVGPFKPSIGGCEMEARLKIADITTGAVYVGFTETLDKTTPVMPAEFATATMTYNGSGGMVGLQFDSDGTTDDWRAVGGDGGAVSGDADTNGTAAGNAAVNDKWDVIRVEIAPDGTGRVYLATDSGGLELVKNVGTAVTATDLFYAVVMIENRSAAASVMEVDYIAWRSFRDWTQ